MYTTAFGAYATWLFIRTGSLAAPVAVHVLCNAVGLPDFDAMAAHEHQPLLSAATGAGQALFQMFAIGRSNPFQGSMRLLSMRTCAHCD